MGMDGLELVLEVEETFGVEIDDAAAERILTVGELWDYICARVDFAPAATCATASAFYKLRRTLGETIGGNRRQLRASTPLDSLLPAQARRAAWTSLQQTAQLTFPKLEFHPRVKQMPLVLALLIFAAVGTAYFVTLGFRPILAVLAMSLGFVACWTLLEWAMAPLKTHLNPAWDTTGGLARAIVGLNPQAWATDEKSREVSWERLRAMIAKQLDVSLDLVRPEASFVEDLGMS